MKCMLNFDDLRKTRSRMMISVADLWSQQLPLFRVLQTLLQTCGWKCPSVFLCCEGAWRGFRFFKNETGATLVWFLKLYPLLPLAFKDPTINLLRIVNLCSFVFSWQRKFGQQVEVYMISHMAKHLQDRNYVSHRFLSLRWPLTLVATVSMVPSMLAAATWTV